MIHLIGSLQKYNLRFPKHIYIRIIRSIPGQIFCYSRELMAHLSPRLQKMGVLMQRNTKVADYLFFDFEHKVNFAARHCPTSVVAELLNKYTVGEMEMIILTNRYFACKNEINFHKLLGSAFASGNIATVELIFCFGARIKDYAFYGACRSGSLPLIQYILERWIPDWSRAAVAACRGGHLHIVKVIAQCGIVNWNSCLCAASRAGSLKLVEYLIEKGADNFNAALALACRAGAAKVVQLLLDCGATNYRNAFEMSCRGGYLRFAKYFARKTNVNWNNGLLLAIKTNNKMLLKYLLRRSTNLNSCFEVACGLGNMVVIKMFIIYGADNIEAGARIAARTGNHHVVEFLKKL